MKNIFYFEFNNGSFVTDIELRESSHFRVPLQIVQYANKMVNITERTVVKDRYTGVYRKNLHVTEIQKLMQTPYVPFKSMVEQVSRYFGVPINTTGWIQEEELEEHCDPNVSYERAMKIL